MNATPIILTCKFQIKIIPDETFREISARFHLKSVIELVRPKASTGEEKYKTVHKEMHR